MLLLSQMFSLTVIFINVVVAANDFPEEQEDSISTILVMLNIIVLVIITGKILHVFSCSFVMVVKFTYIGSWMT